MNSIIKFVSVVLFLFIIMGCRNTTVTLSGQVYDSRTGLPIKEAVVTDGHYGMGNSSVTDGDGSYSYETYCEEHNIEIKAEGYKDANETLLTPFIPSSQPLTLDVYLEPH